jgi:hypothetical protein
MPKTIDVLVDCCVKNIIPPIPVLADYFGSDIITERNKKVYLGASGYSDFTIHKDEARKQRYIDRHKTNENWSKSGIDAAGFWSGWLLWNLPTIKDSYMDIKRRFNI